jgi:hypothetical protein
MGCEVRGKLGGGDREFGDGVFLDFDSDWTLVIYCYKDNLILLLGDVAGRMGVRLTRRGLDMSTSSTSLTTRLYFY